MKYFLPIIMSALLLLYKSFVLCTCHNNGNIARGNGNKTHLDSILILRLQKRAVRLCGTTHYFANNNPIFKMLGLLKIT